MFDKYYLVPDTLLVPRDMAINRKTQSYPLIEGVSMIL